MLEWIASVANEKPKEHTRTAPRGSEGRLCDHEGDAAAAPLWILIIVAMNTPMNEYLNEHANKKNCVRGE